MANERTAAEGIPSKYLGIYASVDFLAGALWQRRQDIAAVKCAGNNDIDARISVRKAIEAIKKGN